jgi:hypothetical protein
MVAVVHQNGSRRYGHSAAAHRIELRQAVIDQEQLHQQRRATEEEDVGVGQARTYQLRGAGDAQRNRQQQAGDHGNGHQFEGQGRALRQFRQPLDDHFPVHEALLAKPRAARFSRKCMPVMASTVRPGT